MCSIFENDIFNEKRKKEDDGNQKWSTGGGCSVYVGGQGQAWEDSLWIVSWNGEGGDPGLGACLQC